VSNEDYRIGPGDVISIRVEKADELSQSFQVSARGAILMNYLGSITVADMTPQEVQAKVTERLRGRYLRNPYVTVAVTQYNSRTFFIQGAVRNPGVYQVRGRPSLLTLITLAGGLERDHGSTAYLIRKPKTSPGESEVGSEPANSNVASPEKSGASEGAPDGDQYRMIKVNIEALFKGNFALNWEVEPGDIVNVPRSDVFFVAGEVHKPGSFQLAQGMTLRQAISLAEGTTFKAKTGSGIIFREDSNTGKREEISVDIGSIMSGKKEDIPILANDVVVVPNSRFKSLSAVILNGPLLNSVGMIYRY
jgi:polysaccharide export outer membrane protein